MYTIDFKKLFKRLIPTFLQKQTHLSWLFVLSQPIQYAHKVFLQYRAQKLDELSYNAQVLKLEYLLNKTFDSDYETNFLADLYNSENKKKIYIESILGKVKAFYLFIKDQEGTDDKYLYEKAEELEQYYQADAEQPTYLFDAESFEVGIDDFVIKYHISLALGTENDDIPNKLGLLQLKGLVNKYKLAGTQYKVEQFE